MFDARKILQFYNILEFVLIIFFINCFNFKTKFNL